MPVPPEQQEIYVAIWAKAVDTQMHFNEMSVKSRQFGLAFVAAALGLAVVLLSRGEEFSFPVPYFGGFDLHATVLIILVSALALYAVSILDITVYHKMLRGAVTFGEDFERNYMRQIFDLNMGMTEAISHFSRFEDAAKEVDNGRYKYTGQRQKTALDKVRKFYRTTIMLLVLAAGLLFLFTANFGHPGGSKGHIADGASSAGPGEESNRVSPQLATQGSLQDSAAAPSVLKTGDSLNKTGSAASVANPKPQSSNRQ